MCWTVAYRPSQPGARPPARSIAYGEGRVSAARSFENAPCGETRPKSWSRQQARRDQAVIALRLAEVDRDRAEPMSGLDEPVPRGQHLPPRIEPRTDEDLSRG